MEHEADTSEAHTVVPATKITRDGEEGECFTLMIAGAPLARASRGAEVVFDLVDLDSSSCAVTEGKLSEGQLTRMPQGLFALVHLTRLDLSRKVCR